MDYKTKRLFLKPCPLCGSAPQLKLYECDPWGDGAGYATVYYYQCSGCGYIRANGAMSTSYSDNAQAFEKAKEDWNSTTEEVIDLIKERVADYK